MLGGRADLAKGNLLSFQVGRRLDRPVGENNQLTEVVGPGQRDDRLCVDPRAEHHVFRRPGEGEVELLRGHGFDRGRTSGHGKKLDLEAGGSFERLLEWAEVALKGLKPVDIRDRKPQRLLSARRRGGHERRDCGHTHKTGQHRFLLDDFHRRATTSQASKRRYATDR